MLKLEAENHTRIQFTHIVLSARDKNQKVFIHHNYFEIRFFFYQQAKFTHRLKLWGITSLLQIAKTKKINRDWSHSPFCLIWCTLVSLFLYFLEYFFILLTLYPSVSLPPGGAAECCLELVAEGLDFHHHHPRRYPQVFLWHQCDPRGQRIPADGESCQNTDASIRLNSKLFSVFRKCRI